MAVAFLFTGILPRKSVMFNLQTPRISFEIFCVTGCDYQLRLLRPGRLGPLEVVSEVGKFA